MKQNITLEQYQELNEDNRVKWAKVVVKHLNKHLHNSDISLKDVDYVDIHQSTTIGQMIEFLYGKKQPGKFNSLIISGSKGKGWFVDGKSASNCCDALWQAVKEVLEND